MNWEAIGAIGEVLGAAGVILTLGYLAFQIRQNNRHLAQEAQRSRSQAIRENMRIMTENAEVCMKDSDGEALTSTESFQLDNIWYGTLWSFQTSFLQLPRHQIAPGATTFRRLFETMPSMATAWEQHRDSFDPNFVRFMEENVINER